ncbi:MAG: histidinol-phosphate aminotransferase family protein [Chloroflexota bacterium]|nr:histidinol-phosphate aminotransferase family protein [Chloroflexota bacterium]
MTPAPRPHLAALETAVHGGPNYAELERLGLTPDKVLDFSANTNPTEPPVQLRQLLADVSVARYPDSDCLELRRAAAERYGVDSDTVMAGNGSVELIRLLCAAFLGAGDSALFGEPTFGEYEVATRLQGAETLLYPVFPVAPSTPALSRLVADTRPQLLFVCNPNNPTGHFTPPDELLTIAQANPETLIVVDEAYVDFVSGGRSVIRTGSPDNLAVLRSMTKFPALAGLRVGLLFAPAPVVAVLRKIQPPWSVNAMAQAAGTYVLRHVELGPDLPGLAQAEALLRNELSTLGLNPRESSCNFFLLDVSSLPIQRNEGETASGAARRALLGRRCLVRDCTSFGLPDHIRISVRKLEECRILVEAFRSLAEGSGDQRDKQP